MDFIIEKQNIVNKGISGDITSGVFYRLEEVSRHQPYKIFIEIGINYIGHNLCIDFTISNYSKIIEQIKRESPQTSIYIQSLLPVNNRCAVIGFKKISIQK